MGFDSHDVYALEPERFAPWNLTPEELRTQIDPAESGRAIPWEDLDRDQQEFQVEQFLVIT